MNGKDLLIEKLIEKGCTKQQATAKAVDLMLEIFAEADNQIDVVQCLQDAKKEYETATKQMYYQQNKYVDKRQDLFTKECDLKQWERKIKERERQLEEEEKAHEKRLKELEEFSTDKAKDAYRLACIYEDKCNPEFITGWNGYTTTAFVREYGRILGTATDDAKCTKDYFSEIEDDLEEEE